MEGNTCREQKHIVLKGAINRLQNMVGLAEGLLRELTPRSVNKAPDKALEKVGPSSQVEEGPVFQEVYDNAPHKINEQSGRLEKVILELREVLL